ncbi:hypothetical protein F5B20DRAFT_583052 [Whalleya microplaca]|nr:hypothetical protein F5B20DRAFT_583052 [Whalleya microplaca]
MSSSTYQNAYSTLEVDIHAQNLNNYPQVRIENYPEVNQDAMAHLRYPEVVSNGSDPLGYPEKESVDPFVETAAATTEPKICGLRRRTFWFVLALIALVVAGIIAGVVAGLLSTRARAVDNSGAPQQTNGSALLAHTRLASTNFTDGSGNENYLVFYQLDNGAIHMSAWNSSYKKWVVSPVVDGTNGISLDDVYKGTSIGVDVFRHSQSARNIHLYWMSPNKLIKSLFRANISTYEPSRAEDWDIPPANDKFVASLGGSLAAYGKQCDECTNWTYFFWEAEDDTMGGAELSLPTTGVWKGLPFDKSAYLPPSTNTSMALTNTAAVNGTTSLNLFYRSNTGSLSMLNFDGSSKFWGVNLPRDISADASIVAFSTGWNDTGSQNPEPLGFQVLTVDPEVDNGVQLTYYKDSQWQKMDSEVQSLSDCASLGSMAVNKGRRIYCLIKGAEGNVEIVEWNWKGDTEGNADTFTSYDRVGVVSTSI